MNVTPDSFSDGGYWEGNLNSLPDILRRNAATIILDVGAESTAPGRTHISVEEEIERLDYYFFSKINQFPISLNLSFDTYKVETIQWCLEKIKSYPQVKAVYWNDVSGQYQDGVIKLLKLYPQLNYILCHNRVVSRDDVLNHAQYADLNSEQMIVDIVIAFFQSALKFFQSENLAQRVILDPAFGFAKTRQDNWQLVDSLTFMISYFPKNDFLVGISRKSFLRDIGKKYQDIGQAEKVLANENLILAKLLANTFKQKVIWRTHHESIVELLK